jgi:hypothetical protein
MEIVDNVIMLAIPGAMDAGVTSGVFWGSLAVALAVAFALTVPVNRCLIARGRGHAVVHRYHPPRRARGSLTRNGDVAPAPDASPVLGESVTSGRSS